MLGAEEADAKAGTFDRSHLSDIKEINEDDQKSNSSPAVHRSSLSRSSNPTLIAGAAVPNVAASTIYFDDDDDDDDDSLHSDLVDDPHLQNSGSREAKNRPSSPVKCPDKEAHFTEGSKGSHILFKNGGRPSQGPGTATSRHNGPAATNDSYLINEDTACSERLRSDKNIYANRYAHTSKRFQGFWHLILHWKGSVLKLVYHDLLAFLLLYYALNFTYRYWLWYDEVAREYFELICVYCSRFRSTIPITFLTGFYVSEVVKRYWDQFLTLPVPDLIALRLISFVPGKEPFKKNLRRTVMRYVNLSIVLVFRLVSPKVRERFPDYRSLVAAKLMLPHEAERLLRVERGTPHESTWTPVLWALKLLERARVTQKVTIEPPIFANLVSSFDSIENANRKLLNYGWVNFPLAYTQVATVSVFAYMFATLFATQSLLPRDDSLDRTSFPAINVTFSVTEPFKGHTPNMGFPFFTVLEFLSYMGWIKVAETLLNPFGDDDEDFQINYLIDRNLQVSYMIVDNADREIDMSTDPFTEAGIEVPANLPYMDEAQQEESYRRVVAAEETPSLAKKFNQRINKMVRRSSSNRHRMDSLYSVTSSVHEAPYGGCIRGSLHHVHHDGSDPHQGGANMDQNKSKVKTVRHSIPHHVGGNRARGPKQSGPSGAACARRYGGSLDNCVVDSPTNLLQSKLRLRKVCLPEDKLAGEVIEETRVDEQDSPELAQDGHEVGSLPDYQKIFGLAPPRFPEADRGPSPVTLESTMSSTLSNIDNESKLEIHDEVESQPRRSRIKSTFLL